MMLFLRLMHYWAKNMIKLAYVSDTGIKYVGRKLATNSSSQKQAALHHHGHRYHHGHWEPEHSLTIQKNRAPEGAVGFN